jgi:hypothetical protein
MPVSLGAEIAAAQLLEGAPSANAPAVPSAPRRKRDRVKRVGTPRD